MSGNDEFFIADSIPLVSADDQRKYLLIHPDDTSIKGLANEVRVTLAHQDRVTSYKDSHPVLADCVGPMYLSSFATAANGGWLVDFTAGTFKEGDTELPLPIGRFRRLTFGGSVIVRTGTWSGANSVRPSLWFADESPLPPLPEE